MDSKSLLCSLLLILGAWISVTNSVTVTIKASKYLLTKADTSVDLQCNGLTPDANTQVVFSVNNVVVYDNKATTPGLSGVTVKNSSVITYSRSITSGVPNAGCALNKTLAIINTTIPYLTLNFQPVPALFNISTQINAKCNVSFAPNVTGNYWVSFFVNQTEVARWTVDGAGKPTFTPLAPASLTVLSGGVPQLPTYSALLTPKTKDAQGQYYCQVAITGTNPTKSPESNIWKTNASFQAAASFSSLMAMIATALVAQWLRN